MSSRFILPFADVGSGIEPSSGAKLFFFEVDGVTPKDTFSDQLATPTPNTNPVIANANGVFSDIYIVGDYKVDLQDKNGSQIFGGVIVVEVETKTGTSELIDRLNPDTLAIWQADALAQAGEVVTTKERSTGDGGGATGDVISGTGTANGFDIVAHDTLSLSFKLRVRGKMYVEMYGVSQSNSIVVNTNAFHAAFNDMAGAKIYMLNKRYTYSGTYASPVNLIGDQRPTVNSARTALENGSILEGSTNFSGIYVYLVNVGIDHGITAFPTVAADAFKASASPFNSGRLCVLHGVVGIGRNNTDAFHAILVEGYEQAWVTECVGCKNQFAGAIKSRNIEVDGYRSIEGQNLLIIKSDTGAAAGTASNVNVSNFVGDGSPTDTQHGLRVLSDNAALERINISNVNITESDRAITLEATTTLNEVNLTNINASQINLIGLVTSGTIRNINLTNVHMVELDDKAADLLAGTLVTINNAYFSLKSTSTSLATAFQVGASVTGFKASLLSIVENRDNGVPGTITFANTPATNSLSQIIANIANNIPQIGLQTEPVDDGLIVPKYFHDARQTNLILTSTANRTITNIATTMPGTTTVFPIGYEIHLLSSANVITYTDGANMRMKDPAASTHVYGLNKVASFKWWGSSWHQLDGAVP